MVVVPNQVFIGSHHFYLTCFQVVIMVEAGDDGSLSSEPGEVEAVACPTEAGALEAGSDGPGALLAPLEPSSPQSHQPGDPPVLPYMSSRASGLEGSRPDVAPLCIAPMVRGRRVS